MISLLSFLTVMILVGAAFSALGTPNSGDSAPPSPPETDDEAFDRLVDEDPAEALIRFGTDDDAERLISDGIDLEALGYRPPEER